MSYYNEVVKALTDENIEAAVVNKETHYVRWGTPCSALTVDKTERIINKTETISVKDCLDVQRYVYEQYKSLRPNYNFNFPKLSEKDLLWNFIVVNYAELYEVNKIFYGVDLGIEDCVIGINYGGTDE